MDRFDGKFLNVGFIFWCLIDVWSNVFWEGESRWWKLAFANLALCKRYGLQVKIRLKYKTFKMLGWFICNLQSSCSLQWLRSLQSSCFRDYYYQRAMWKTSSSVAPPPHLIFLLGPREPGVKEAVPASMANGKLETCRSSHQPGPAAVAIEFKNLSWNQGNVSWIKCLGGHKVVVKKIYSFTSWAKLVLRRQIL